MRSQRIYMDCFTYCIQFIVKVNRSICNNLTRKVVQGSSASKQGVAKQDIVLERIHSLFRLSLFKRFEKSRMAQQTF